VSRISGPFAALIAAQAAHSIEEYRGRPWESFPPARLVSGLVSSDPERGFVIANAALAGFGVWCALGPVRRAWPIAPALAWGWIVIETINGSAIRSGRSNVAGIHQASRRRRCSSWRPPSSPGA
jgi:hypothetical protein